LEHDLRIALFYETTPDRFGYTTNPYGFGYRDLGFGNIRRNRGYSGTVFRVNVTDLQPRTTYYYEVMSTESDGTSCGVTSSVSQFSTRPAGKFLTYRPRRPGDGGR
jgi:hypothetical protein